MTISNETGARLYAIHDRVAAGRVTAENAPADLQFLLDYITQLECDLENLRVKYEAKGSQA